MTVPTESDPSDRSGRNFGSLSTDISSRRLFRKSNPEIRDLRQNDGDDEEEDPERPHRRPVGRNTPYWYFLKCKKLIRENKLHEALDVFSKDMLQEERLQPEEFNYTVLIGGCGRAGLLKKTFKLYNDMKKRGLEATDATYTALFNACAESPSKQAGLQQALKLEQELRRKNYPLSTITYHALLKTHAYTNHLQACIHTIKEMLQNGHVVTQETFHYLLMSCLKDKETGFRLALQVWRQMLRSGIHPDSKNYNLLLRTARDCGIGNRALATRVLLSPDLKYEGEGVSHVKSNSRYKNLIDIDFLERQLFIQPEPLSDTLQDSRYSEEEESYRGKDSTQLVPVRQTISLPVDSLADSSSAPNLLDVFEGKRGCVVSLCAVDRVSDRLALIGGAEGFLEKMEANRLSPDIRTLTLLADTMEPGFKSLQTLLNVAKQHKVKLDVAFFNSVIRRTARAGDLEGAKMVLSVMRQRHVNVDVQTFGSLALGCEREKDALQLLKTMEEAGLKPNVQVFSALIGIATRKLDYIYLKTILKCMSTMKVWPNEVIIRQLEFASQYPPNYNQYKSRNNYLIQIDGFRGFYQNWLRYMPAESADDEQAELQTEMDAAEGEGELTESQRKQRAAARRFNSRKKDKTSSTLSIFLMCTTVDNGEIIILSDDEDDKEDCDISCNEASVVIVEAEDVKKNDCVLSPSALDEDLVVTFSRRAEVLPHARYDCPVHPFLATDCEVGAPVAENKLFCDQCYCYICDKLASLCEMWCHKGLCHSNSHKRSDFWSHQRNTALLGRLKSFDLTLSEIDAHLRHAEAMLQSFRQELSAWFLTFQKGKSFEEYGLKVYNQPGRIHDYTEVYEFVSSFLNKADKQDGRAAAVMNLGAAEDFIRHFHVTGALIPQSPTSNAAEAKAVLLKRVISSLQRQMVMADFTPEFIHKLQEFYKRFSFPHELKSLRNRLCVRPWDDVLLVSVLKGQNVSGVRTDKGKKDVLIEQFSIVLLRTEALQQQHRYKELCRYLRVVQTEDPKLLQQVQDLIPFFTSMEGDFTSAMHRFFPSVNAPASRLTPPLFMTYFYIFKFATAPKLVVSQHDQICFPAVAWEPIKDAKPMMLAELVKFALRVQKCCSAVYNDSQCWTILLKEVNSAALPAPSPQFLLEAKDRVNLILLNMNGTNIYIPRFFLEVYPDQALLLLVTGALRLRILNGALTPALTLLSTFQENVWAQEWLWETLSVERLGSFVQEITQEMENTTDGGNYVPLLRAIIPTLSSSTESWDQQSSGY
ncbi:uncharacterized protein LKV04_001959 [Tautogolabrus adspersus]